MHASHTLRRGIAMIELIFALLIMGIALMSAPMLISTATNSGYVAIQQEAINQAASRINMIMGYPWDENNTQDDNVFPILHVSNGEATLEMNATTFRRNGTPKESRRSFVLSGDPANSDLNASALGSDGGDEDDMDDFTGTTISFNSGSAATDYVDNNISMVTTLRYMKASSISPNGANTITFNPNFTQDAPTTNIKSITVTLTSNSGVAELSKTITLHAFSCNIGSYTFQERSF